jgi:hypothetical protein
MMKQWRKILANTAWISRDSEIIFHCLWQWYKYYIDAFFPMLDNHESSSSTIRSAKKIQQFRGWRKLSTIPSINRDPILCLFMKTLFLASVRFPMIISLICCITIWKDQENRICFSFTEFLQFQDVSKMSETMMKRNAAQSTVIQYFISMKTSFLDNIYFLVPSIKYNSSI